MGVREPRARLGLELVAGEVLRLEREGVREVRVEIGGALARDPVDEIERDVVETGITKSVQSAPDVVRTGNALERLELHLIAAPDDLATRRIAPAHPRRKFPDLEQPRPEGLRAERDAVHATRAQQGRERGGHCLGVRLDGQLLGLGQRPQHALERPRFRERRRASAEEGRLDVRSEPEFAAGSGGGVGPLPAPWLSQDVGAVASTIRPAE